MKPSLMLKQVKTRKCRYRIAACPKAYRHLGVTEFRKTLRSD